MSGSSRSLGPGEEYSQDEYLEAPDERASDPGQEPELSAPARPKRADRASAASAIIPAGSVTGDSLTLVIAIMCFLACLTAGAVYIVNQSAAAWTQNVASEVTVQVEPRDGVEMEKRVTEIALLIAKERGIVEVRPLTPEESGELLEPWLGQTDVLQSLPIPRLIAVEIDRADPPDLEHVRSVLAASFPETTLDDHRHWQVQIRTVTRSLALAGLGILILVCAATIAIIVSATRSSMASNREIVEVLHFVGATDRFIAREFEKHFLALGIRAGLVGAGTAIVVFAVMPYLMPIIGGGAVAEAEVRNLFGYGSLDLSGYGLLVIVVVAIAALCMLTSRYSVYRFLDARN